MPLRDLKKKELFFFLVRVVIVTLGLSYVFLTHVYRDARAVDGPITYGFPFPTCTFSASPTSGSDENCSTLGKIGDVFTAGIVATLIMLLFRHIAGITPHIDPSGSSSFSSPS